MLRGKGEAKVCAEVHGCVTAACAWCFHCIDVRLADYSCLQASASLLCVWGRVDAAGYWRGRWIAGVLGL